MKGEKLKEDSKAFQFVTKSKDDPSLKKIKDFARQKIQIADKHGKINIITCNLEQKIDSGSYSEVYEGTIEDGSGGKRVALKIIPYDKGFEIQKTSFKQIEREIKFFEESNPLSISVKFYGFFKSPEEKLVYLVFEMMTMDLSTFFVKSGKENVPVPIKIRAMLMQKLVIKLGYLQDLGILHQDLKAKNFLLKIPASQNQAEIDPFVCDFGNAIYEKEISKEIEIAGTEHYLAPEYAKYLLDEEEDSAEEYEKENRTAVENEGIPGDKNYVELSSESEISTFKISQSYKSDIFSLGLCFMFMLGHRTTGLNLNREELDAAIDSVVERHDLSPEFEAIFRKMLDWQRENRPDFTELAEYFSLFLNTTGSFIRQAGIKDSKIPEDFFILEKLKTLSPLSDQEIEAYYTFKEEKKHQTFGTEYSVKYLEELNEEQALKNSSENKSFSLMINCMFQELKEVKKQSHIDEEFVYVNLKYSFKSFKLVWELRKLYTAGKKFSWKSCVFAAPGLPSIKDGFSYLIFKIQRLHVHDIFKKSTKENSFIIKPFKKFQVLANKVQALEKGNICLVELREA